MAGRPGLLRQTQKWNAHSCKRLRGHRKAFTGVTLAAKMGALAPTEVFQSQGRTGWPETDYSKLN